MPERVARAFGIYLQLRPKRSLEKLVLACQNTDELVSIATIKRWSVRYGWARRVVLNRRRVVLNRRRVARKIENHAVSEAARSLKYDLRALGALRSRFAARLLIDPGDPNLTQAERRRALRPSFCDFRHSIELEKRLLRGSPSPTIVADSVTSKYSKQEVIAMEAALAHVRYGTPKQK